ncbi:hypothetical protein ACE1ET_08310 [Saccharicrinis sp. FJH62]|uniref:hypothetical protein n=1 Tax=Saccharicrinis sp. FJH62 TaxID=3344657 RepID=UPI0035D4E17B
MRAGHLIQIFSVFMFSCLITSCHFKGKNEAQNYPLQKTDSCVQHPAHSYEIFIPEHKNPDQKLPLLVAVDAHGSGQTAVKHLKEAVTSFPAVLVASNLIQNSDPNFIKELDELIADVKKRYPVNDQVYLTGFSGGARMVLGYAMNHPVNGVLACGAFSGTDQLSAIKCPVMGLLGMTDFNFLETVQYIFDPAKLPDNAHVELINGSHEWPDSSKLTNSWGWFWLQDQNIDEATKVKLYVDEQKARIDSLTDVGQYLQAACISRNMGSVEAFEKIFSFREKIREITYSKDYSNQLSQLSDVLRFEVGKRQEYSQALLEKDSTWWKKEIDDLNNHVDLEPDKMKRMAYARLKSFLGIACYSYASRFVVQKNIANLEQILMVYRLAEPNNADLKRFNKFLTELRGQ